MEVDVGRPAAAFEHELASKDMILAHPRRTDEEHVCHGTFRNEFQKRESMVARYQRRSSMLCWPDRQEWPQNVDGGEGTRDRRLANPLEVVRCALPRARQSGDKINQEPAPRCRWCARGRFKPRCNGTIEASPWYVPCLALPWAKRCSRQVPRARRRIAPLFSLPFGVAPRTSLDLPS
jgi:hypothetical protein